MLYEHLIEKNNYVKTFCRSKPTTVNKVELEIKTTVPALDNDSNITLIFDNGVQRSMSELSELIGMTYGSSRNAQGVIVRNIIVIKNLSDIKTQINQYERQYMSNNY